MRKLLCFALTLMVGLCSVGLLAGCGGKKESDGKTNVRIAISQISLTIRH